MHRVPSSLNRFPPGPGFAPATLALTASHPGVVLDPDNESPAGPEDFLGSDSATLSNVAAGPLTASALVTAEPDLTSYFGAAPVSFEAFVN